MISTSPQSDSNHREGGFTLVELLVAVAILAMIVGLLLTMVSQTSKTWKSTSGKIEQFRDARVAFDAITRKLGQATLNTYYDYDNPTNPTSYMRQSELRFLCGPADTIIGGLASNKPSMAVFFQAPVGFATNSTNSLLQNTLNTWGYFVEYASDANNRPDFLNGGVPKARERYRLMEFMEPTESLSVYNYTTNRSYAGTDWVSNSLALPEETRPVHVLAENVIALILLPKLAPGDMTNKYTASSLAPDYVYSSANTNQTDPYINPHHQLPPVVQVTMIAVDETSFVRYPGYLQDITNQYGSLFQDSSMLTNDLSTLQKSLSSHKINYRVFTTDVMIKEATWSKNQKH